MNGTIHLLAQQTAPGLSPQGKQRCLSTCLEVYSHHSMNTSLVTRPAVLSIEESWNLLPWRGICLLGLLQPWQGLEALQGAEGAESKVSRVARPNKKDEGYIWRLEVGRSTWEVSWRGWRSRLWSCSQQGNHKWQHFAWEKVLWKMSRCFCLFAQLFKRNDKLPGKDFSHRFSLPTLPENGGEARSLPWCADRRTLFRRRGRWWGLCWCRWRALCRWWWEKPWGAASGKAWSDICMIKL